MIVATVLESSAGDVACMFLARAKAAATRFVTGCVGPVAMPASATWESRPGKLPSTPAACGPSSGESSRPIKFFFAGVRSKFVKSPREPFDGIESGLLEDFLLGIGERLFGRVAKRQFQHFPSDFSLRGPKTATFEKLCVNPESRSFDSGSAKMTMGMPAVRESARGLEIVATSSQFCTRWSIAIRS